jgi:methylphosphotriester-DNA--protein-cysteine methyltransferase
MNFYQQQLLKIKKECYPADGLVEQVVNAKVFIDNNFSDTINADDIAGKAFYSKFHFIRLFKSCYGRTPHQYLKELRVQKAKEMISKGMSVRQACSDVGFCSTSSFSGLFKKITGKQPSFFVSPAK